MNALTKFQGMSAAAFAELILSPEDLAITIEDDVIRFDLVQRRTEIMIQGEIQGQLVTKTVSIPAENPEFDRDETLSVMQIETEWPIAIVVDYQDIAAVSGQPFMLTKEQIGQINQRLEEMAMEGVK